MQNVKDGAMDMVHAGEDAVVRLIKVEGKTLDVEMRHEDPVQEGIQSRVDMDHERAFDGQKSFVESGD